MKSSYWITNKNGLSYLISTTRKGSNRVDKEYTINDCTEIFIVSDNKYWLIPLTEVTKFKNSIIDKTHVGRPLREGSIDWSKYIVMEK